MNVDTSKLANVIFKRGSKITQTAYQQICESIESEAFTLDEYVCEYKARDLFAGKIAYKLSDGSTVLVEEKTIKSLNALNNVDKDKLVTFMSACPTNFKKVVGILYGDQ